jgi:large subunit ribosomal protein L21
MAFAVIQTGGKQYKVSEGDVISVEKLPEEEGKTVTFSDVLLADDGKSTKVGTPLVVGISVSGKVLEQGRDKKISVIKFKSKSRYFRNKGHRQPFTKIEITKIGKGASVTSPKESKKEESKIAKSKTNKKKTTTKTAPKKTEKK